METLVVDDWTVRHDRAATAAYYRTLAHGDADRCGCSFCSNFALQRPTAFPPEFLGLMERPGIDAGREHEVYEMGPVGDGLRLYAGWFCFVGGFTRIGAEASAAFDDARRFGFGFTDGFPWSGTLPRASVSAVGFSMPLPWLLPWKTLD